MKTSEFVKRVNELGYETVNYDYNINVFRGNNALAKVSKFAANMLDTYWNEDVSDELFDILVAYARTPIGKRGDVKKYYLYNPVQDAYFNYYVEIEEYSWLNSTQSHDIQTQFTEEEIKNHKFKDIMELLVKKEVK